MKLVLADFFNLIPVPQPTTGYVAPVHNAKLENLNLGLVHHIRTPSVKVMDLYI
jgi:hypothetical protein